MASRVFIGGIEVLWIELGLGEKGFEIKGCGGHVELVVGIADSSRTIFQGVS
jgi:hypothetical protein